MPGKEIFSGVLIVFFVIFIKKRSRKIWVLLFVGPGKLVVAPPLGGAAGAGAGLVRVSTNDCAGTH